MGGAHTHAYGHAYAQTRTHTNNMKEEGVRGTTQEEKGIVELGGEQEIVMDDYD